MRHTLLRTARTEHRVCKLILRKPGVRAGYGKDLHLADEVRHIQRYAARHTGRIVTVGQLILFSTQTGDAWLLDKEDGLAAQLARDGDPEPIHIEETDANFSIEWKGRYRIEGTAFVYVDRKTGGTRTILGYPTQRMEHAGRGR
jgi:hypothetical protein